MAGVRSFTDLLIWQRARTWSKAIYFASQSVCFRRDQRLVRQINDSSASVMANIAEGFGRGTQGEFILFLGYSIGSLDETRSHLTVAYDREYIARDDYGELFSQGTTIRKMTVAFIGSMIMPGSGVKHVSRQEDWSERVWQMYEQYTGKQRPEIFLRAAEQKRRISQETMRTRRRRRMQNLRANSRQNMSPSTEPHEPQSQ